MKKKKQLPMSADVEIHIFSSFISDAGLTENNPPRCSPTTGAKIVYFAPCTFSPQSAIRGATSISIA